MTYNTNIQQTQMAVIPEFYSIAWGSTIERYTNYSTDLDFLFHTWKGVPIKRTSFSRDNDFKVLETTITTTPSDLLKKYVALQPVQPVDVVIYRSVMTDLTSYTTLFRGRIKNVQFASGQVQAQCVANACYLKKKIPFVCYQAFCNHTLFDSGCGLVSGAYKTLGTLTYVSNTELKASAFALQPDGYFDQGYVKIGDDYRLIIKHIGNTLTIHAPFDVRAAIGVSVEAYPGCDKNPATCDTKFNNLTNFLGCPYIPSSNPVLSGFR